MNPYNLLKKKIKEKKAVITVVGLGYVGLPMAIEFAKKGFSVTGLDSNVRRISRLKKGSSYLNDITDGEIRGAIKHHEFTVTSNKKILASSDVIIICVPTPLRKIKEPDVSFVAAASRTVAKYLRKGQIIILESTTYPGTTRDIVLPVLSRSGLKLGIDFFLSFSPERIDPGNKKYSFTNIPKVIGGMTKECGTLTRALYSQVVKRIVKVSSPETAEVTKLLENTFRIVNIGLINEFALLCYKLGIDVWEVIKSAETKPFGFMPFYPGPGIGGHCIPADPMYLSWKARKVGFQTRMIDLAAELNRSIPGHIVNRAGKILGSQKKKLKDSRVFVVGITYKKDVNDLRESPALDIFEGLMKKNAKVSYYDPFIPYLNLPGIRSKRKPLDPGTLRKQDIVIITTDHSGIDYKMIMKYSSIVFDTRDIMMKLGIKGDNIVRL